MINSVAFRTQARTVDHLGREQIADCPTAVSELWKNAYDAYSRSVELHIFDGEEPVAAIFDDGHGMSYVEFLDRWLVVGTESKFEAKSSNIDDRNGLPERTKQGQKGIGRLSSANLGPLLLILSKRRDQDFVAALIDWRIFENPYLTLNDIEIPVTSFPKQEEIISVLPALFDRLVENVWGGEDAARAKRLKAAWDAYDRLILEDDQDAIEPSKKIANTIINARFELHHFEQWQVWSGQSEHGTAMLVSDINFDLRAQLPSIEMDGAIKEIREKFFTTLSSFVDPLVSMLDVEINAEKPDFSYVVKIWENDRPEIIVGEDRGFNRAQTDMMEHIIEGVLEDDGTFRGQIKAFGKWRHIGNDYVISPPKDFNVPKGPSTRVGPIDIYIATYERDRVNSSHTDDEFAECERLADRYGGFMLFRNGLRVLPYGRVDNDFFEIEQRRSVNAGREYWNARRMFGRIAISRENNPNLRDKAGREGLIDNRAAKALKTLVVNILRRSAYDYFGSNSEIRVPELEQINLKNRKDKAEAERKKLATRHRKQFRKLLGVRLKDVPLIEERIERQLSDLTISNVEELLSAQQKLEGLREELNGFRLPGAPSPLGSLEDDYRLFRSRVQRCQSLLVNMNEKISQAIQDIKPPKPEEILNQQMQRNAGLIQAELRKWKKQIADLQTGEQSRIEGIFSERNKLFHSMAMPLVERVRVGEIELQHATELMEKWRSEIAEENADIFEGYLNALEVLRDNIDLELIATQGTSDNYELREELSRINQLAQLGITVEILGHELKSYDQMIRSGLNILENRNIEPRATQNIRTGLEGLAKHLDFLSPLKLSGQRTQRYISGREIKDYLREFFAKTLDRENISLEASDEFESFKVFEQPARILPVFINLVNNSIYWLATGKSESRRIALGVREGLIVVSDNGPGVDDVDIQQLFRLFFTRRIGGGNGIGLYLCRMNLAAGGHHIRYAETKEQKVLEGANFVIEFRGAEYGN
ncbi:MAG: ATP-binding protein [Agrobacterium sp.]|uniref:ATP-binding protein n=1 Tax=Agrobacterium sp. TaxID=361 RepID=UPI00403356C0